MFLRMHFVLIRMNPSMQCDPEFFRAREANIDNGNKFVSAGYLKPSNTRNCEFFRTRGTTIEHGYNFVSAGHLKPSMNSKNMNPRIL